MEKRGGGQAGLGGDSGADELGSEHAEFEGPKGQTAWERQLETCEWISREVWARGTNVWDHEPFPRWPQGHSPVAPAAAAFTPR